VPSSDLDVGGLEIAMNDAPLVRRFECVDHLGRDPQRFVDRQRAECEAIGERRPIDQLEHQRGARSAIAQVLLESVNRGDVLVIERGEHLRLAAEARQAVRIAGKSVGQDLERDVAVQARITRPIDLAHPTSPDRAGDFVGTDTVAGDERQLNRATFCHECATGGRAGTSGHQPG